MTIHETLPSDNGVIADVRPNLNQITDFLRLIFGDACEGMIEISVLKESAWFDVGDIEDAALRAHDWNAQGRNVYVCASLLKPEKWAARQSDPKSKGRSQKEDVLCTPALYVDIDAEAPARAAEQFWNEEGCGWYPSAIATTATVPHPRLHAWWRLPEPLKDEAELEATLSALCDALGGDRACVQAGRLMRLPGTVNRPDPKQKPGRVNELVTLRAECPIPMEAGFIVRRAQAASQATKGADEASKSATSEPSAIATKADPSRDMLGRNKVPELVDQIQATTDGGVWRQLVLRLVATMVGRGHRDDEILAFAAAVRWSDYTLEETKADIQQFIAGARRRFQKPEGASETNAPADWPAPNVSLVQPFGDRPVPEFPIDAFPAGMAEAARGIAETTGAPIDFAACALLGLTAGLVGNTRRFSPWAGWSEPCALNVALVGAPSSGKSPVFDKPIELVREIEADLLVDFEDAMRQHETAKAGAEEVHKRWRKDVETATETGSPAPTMPSEAVAPDEPCRPCIVASDATTEALTRLEAGNPRGLVLYRDELTGLIAGMGRYGNDGDRQYFLEAFGGRTFRVDRIKNARPLVIDRHLLSIVGGIQPDRLASLLLKGDDDGLAARFLFCWPAPGRPRRPTRAFNPAPLQRAFRRLHSLDFTEGENGPSPAVMRMTDDAADAFEAARQLIFDREQAASGLLQSFIGKCPGILVRLSGLMELLERAFASGETPGAKEITADAVSSADRLVGYFLGHAERTYGEAGMSPERKNAAALAKAIVQRRTERINARDIRCYTWVPGLRDAKTIDAALAVLVEEDWILPAPSRAGDKKGRPRKDYLVHPAVRSDSFFSSVRTERAQ